MRFFRKRRERTKRLRKTGFQFSKTSIQRMEGIHPKLRSVMMTAIESCPVDFGIASGLRTAEEQAELYAMGRTKTGKIVTNADGYTNKSNHQAKADGYGHAVDVYGYRDGAVWDKEMLETIARHIQKCGAIHGVVIDWGGDWKKFKDYPHLEIKL